MRTLTEEAEAATNAVRERFGAGLRQFEENVEQRLHEGRRVVEKGRRAAEDGIAAATREIRRHPLQATAFAAFAGALAGCIAGFAYGRWVRR
jgi:ElaB/YqjD/DUF883 family membrane-anchored ribosome-binding protein